MKKASMILLVVFLVAVAFTGGFFIGRSLNHSEIRLSQPETTAPTSSATTTATTTATVPPPAPQEKGLININTATVAELITLPNIGEVLAGRIVDYRQANGPFRTLGELTEVEGIGEKRLEAILEHITIGGNS